MASTSGIHRLLLATGLSLLVHFCFLYFLPGFRLAHSGGMHSHDQPVENQLFPSPLTVALGPISFQPPAIDQQASNTKIPDTSVQKPAAPTVSSMGNESGQIISFSGVPQRRPTSFRLDIPHYFKQSEVTERVELLNNIDPDFPEASSLSRSGKLFLTLLINEWGTIDRIVVDGSDIEEASTRAVTLRFQKAVFRPALMHGKAVKSSISVEVFIPPLMRP